MNKQETLVILISGIVVASVMAAVAVIFILPGPEQKVPTDSSRGELNNDGEESLSGDKYKKLVQFPSFTNFQSYSDFYNKDLVWIKGFTSVYSLNTTTEEFIDYTSKVNIEGVTITDIDHVDEDLLVGTHDGLIIYNLASEERRTLTVNEGLPSNANIEVHVDPQDSDILWIQTHQGLVRYERSTSKLQDVFSGKGIEPQIFYISPSYVWVSVGANSYYSGSVQRIEKQNLSVKIWDVESFASDSDIPNLRLDARAHEEEGEIFVFEDKRRYKFLESTDEWGLINEVDWNPKTLEKSIDLNDLGSYLTYFNVEVLDLLGDEVMIRHGKGLDVYNFVLGERKNLPPYDKFAELSGRILPNHYVVHDADYCEGMGCSDFYISTTSVYRRDSGELVSRAIYSTSTSNVQFSVNEGVENIYLTEKKYPEEKTFSSLLNLKENKYFTTDKSIEYVNRYLGESETLELDGYLSGVKVKFAGTAGNLTFNVYIEGDTETKRLSVKLLKTVGQYDNYRVHDVAVYDQKVFFATNHGLVVFDSENKTLEVLGVDDGLYSNLVTKVILSKEHIVLAHSRSHPHEEVVIYRRP